jgi:hypothetical protein
MSALKPVFREARQSVLAGAGRLKDRLHQLADNMDGHLDTIVRRVRDEDNINDAVVTNRGGNVKVTTYDPDTGRPITEYGHIRDDFGSSTRGDNATAIGRLGEGGYDGGHLGAHRFFGDTPDPGIVPQIANLNRGPWKTMENEWADWTAQGYQIDYTIDVYPPGATVPDTFEVAYTVTNPQNGAEIHRAFPYFYNQPDQVFTRVPRDSMPPIG